MPDNHFQDKNNFVAKISQSKIVIPDIEESPSSINSEEKNAANEKTPAVFFILTVNYSICF